MSKYSIMPIFLKTEITEKNGKTENIVLSSSFVELYIPFFRYFSDFSVVQVTMTELLQLFMTIIKSCRMFLISNFILISYFSLLIPHSAEAQKVRKARRGIIIVETDSLARGMEPFSYTPGRAATYAEMVNDYKARFASTRVYCMTIPTAVAFYLPDTVSNWSNDEQRGISDIYAHLKPSVKAIDLLPVLDGHKDEDIYLRTDHHWAPLGAYYAAQAFAQEAGVPFLPLEAYDSCVVRQFVGTMKRFSQDAAIGRVPEDFVYYTPHTVDYSATHVRFSLAGKRRNIVRPHAREVCDFFRHYDDGSPNAYSTFMGGDVNTTSVTTSTKNGRRLLILKDSYGNALASFLFGSFEEIHVVDCRYFTENIVRFAKERQITDVLITNNLLHAYNPVTSQTLRRYLTQR